MTDFLFIFCSWHRCKFSACKMRILWHTHCRTFCSRVALWTCHVPLVL